MNLWNGELKQQREGWDNTAGSHGEPHFMQSWAWGEHSNQNGWTPLRKRLGPNTGGKAGSAQVLVRDIRPGLPLKMAHIPGGPLLDWEDSNQPFLFLEQLEETLRQKNVVLMWIAPPLCRNRAAGLTVLARLEQAGWHFCRTSWLQPDRLVSSLPKSSRTTQAPANGILTGLHLGCEQDRGGIRFGSKYDFDRHFGFSSSSCRAALNSAEIQFCLELLARPQPNGTGNGISPTSVFILAEGPRNELAGAALMVAWQRKSWYITVPFGPESPPTWAREGLRRRAATWAMAQGCTYLDWGPAEANWTDSHHLAGQSPMETCSLSPFIGTWGRLLWPLPNRVSPAVQQILEGLIYPVPPINGHLPV